MKYVWLIYSGCYYNSPWVAAVYEKKKDAIKDITKKTNFKYNKEQNLWLSEDEQTYYKLIKTYLNRLPYEIEE